MMKAKAEIAINCVVIVLALALTIAYALDGNTLLAILFGLIALLNGIGLLLRLNRKNTG